MGSFTLWLNDMYVWFDSQVAVFGRRFDNRLHLKAKDEAATFSRALWLNVNWSTAFLHDLLAYGQT